VCVKCVVVCWGCRTRLIACGIVDLQVPCTLVRNVYETVYECYGCSEEYVSILIFIVFFFIYQLFAVFRRINVDVLFYNSQIINIAFSVVHF
jgi:hypothetical protein